MNLVQEAARDSRRRRPATNKGSRYTAGAVPPQAHRLAVRDRPSKDLLAPVKAEDAASETNLTLK